MPPYYFLAGPEPDAAGAPVAGGITAVLLEAAEGGVAEVAGIAATAEGFAAPELLTPGFAVSPDLRGDFDGRRFLRVIRQCHVIQLAARPGRRVASTFLRRRILRLRLRTVLGSCLVELGRALDASSASRPSATAV